MPSNINCPNCGASLDRRIQSSKVVGCASCGSTVFMRDLSFTEPGEQGEFHETPSLLKLEILINLDGQLVKPVGVIRYSYGPGWWDEFWCETGNDGRWVSVDEGDIVIEKPIKPPKAPGPARNLKIGDVVMHNTQNFRAVEMETATCVAFRGELPEAPEIGEAHRFMNFKGPDRKALSLEIWGANEAWFTGRWVDPWQVGSV